MEDLRELLLNTAPTAIAEDAQAIPADGWLVKELECPRCDHRWVGVALVGTKGITCPEPLCSHYDPDYRWTLES